jgi:molecular chaperone DnaK
MKNEAEKFAEADKAKRELIEAKNKANSVAFEIEKQLKDYGDKLKKQTKKRLKLMLKLSKI